MVPSFVLVACILGPYGVKGGVMVKSFCQNPCDLFSFSQIFLGEKKDTLSLRMGHRIKGKGLFVGFLEGVSSRNHASTLCKSLVYVLRHQLQALSEQHAFYHIDLVGLAVVDLFDKPLGTVKSIVNFGASDILCIITPQGREGLVPFAKTWVPEVVLPQDTQGGFIRLSPESDDFFT